jgi:hypothetical protein
MQRVVFLSFLKIIFFVQFDAEKLLPTPSSSESFSLRKLFRVGKQSKLFCMTNEIQHTRPHNNDKMLFSILINTDIVSLQQVSLHSEYLQ